VRAALATGSFPFAALTALDLSASSPLPEPRTKDRQVPSGGMFVAASATLGCISTACISVAWPSALPVPTTAQELRILPTLLPGPRYTWRLDSYESARIDELPRCRREAIAAASVRHGMDPRQAASLRRQVLGSAAPWKLHGDEAAELVAATAFEDSVGCYLRRHSVAFLTQEGIKAEAVAEGKTTHGLATPDFLIRCELTIGGRVVRWIEVKRWYAAGYAGLQPWQPSRKAPKQLERYRLLYGPGAVVFLHGYSAGFRASVHPDVLLLDATPCGLRSVELQAELTLEGCSMRFHTPLGELCCNGVTLCTTSASRLPPWVCECHL
jgi:hypothetical protein